MARQTRPLATLRAVLLVLALLAAGGAVRPDPTAAQEGKLTVLDWAGYDAEELWIDFKQTHPDVDVEFEMGASDADILAKMLAGDQADVFHPYTGWLQFYVEEGLVEEIDTTKLQNWDKVPDRFKQLGQFDGKQYFVPFDWGYSSILYRTDEIPEGIDSWAALFDPKYSGRISMWDDAEGAVDVSCRVHGWDRSQLTDEQLEQIKQEWIEQKEHNLFYFTAEPEVVEAMAAGDVWVAYGWQGTYALLRSQGVPVAFADPEEGRLSWAGYYGIRKGTDDKELALAFLDAKLGEQTGKNLVELFYYGHANEDVMSSIADPELVDALSLNDPSVLDRTHFSPVVTAEEREAWAEMWVDVKAS